MRPLLRCLKAFFNLTRDKCRLGFLFKRADPGFNATSVSLHQSWRSKCWRKEKQLQVGWQMAGCHSQSIVSLHWLLRLLLTNTSRDESTNPSIHYHVNGPEKPHFFLQPSLILSRIYSNDPLPFLHLCCHQTIILILCITMTTSYFPSLSPLSSAPLFHWDPYLPLCRLLFFLSK